MTDRVTAERVKEKKKGEEIEFRACRSAHTTLGCKKTGGEKKEKRKIKKKRFHF